MRLRTQFIVAACVAFALVAAAMGTVWTATARDRSAQSALDVAGRVDREVTGLLVLTQEFARTAEPDAARQWRARYRAMQVALSDLRDDASLPARPGEFSNLVVELPELFARLEVLARGSAVSLHERGDDVVLGQLLSSLGSLVDASDRWAGDVYRVREAAKLRLRRITIGALLVLSALLATMAVLVHRQVLRPLRRLNAAVRSVRDGDLGVRTELASRNEIGDLSREFDAMTHALAGEMKARQRSEAALRAIADHLPALIAHVDADERYTFTNAYYRHVFGIDPASMIGLTLLETRGAKGYDEIKPHLERVMRGEVGGYDGSIKLGSSEHHYHAQYVPDFGDDGAVRGFYTLVSDITGRKQAELRQADSERRMRSILANAPDAFISVDARGRILEWNRQAEITFGWQRDEVVGRSAIDVIVPPRLRAAHAAGMREVTTTGAGPLVGRRIESIALHRDGREIPLEFSVAAVPDAGRYVAHAFLHDITDRRRAQQEIRARERFLRTITDNLPVLISYIDRDERVAFLNGTFRRWTGRDPAEALGKTLVEVLGPEKYADRKPHLERALRGERVSFEVRTHWADRERETQNVYIPDRRHDGRIAGVYTLATDVSEIKRAQRELDRLARQDALTGLPNRRAFEETLVDAIARARHACTGLALIFVDVDRFKSVNDSLGHSVGDAVLAEFARRLRLVVRTSDIVARLGGDEFVVLLEGLTGHAQAATIARKLVESMREPFVIEGLAVGATASAGVAYAEPGGELQRAALMEDADGALYEAKGRGRDGFVLRGFTGAPV